MKEEDKEGGKREIEGSRETRETRETRGTRGTRDLTEHYIQQ
jgi:hypothetical protein